MYSVLNCQCDFHWYCRVFKKELYSGITNRTVGRVLRKSLHLKAYKPFSSSCYRTVWFYKRFLTTEHLHGLFLFFPISQRPSGNFTVTVWQSSVCILTGGKKQVNSFAWHLTFNSFNIFCEHMSSFVKIGHQRWTLYVNTYTILTIYTKTSTVFLLIPLTWNFALG
jgi:hypothetical protein